MRNITFAKKILILTLLVTSLISVGQNTALDFDGTGGAGAGPMSGQLVNPTPMIPLNTSFTVMGWVYVKAGHTQIFSWGSASVNKYIQIKAASNQKLQVYAPSGVINLVSTTTIGSAWHHIAVTNNAGSVTIYVDGVSEGTATADFSTIVPSQSTLGTALLNNLWQGSGNFDIDELSVWNVALSGADVLVYKNASPVGTETGLLVAYDFNTAGVTAGGDNTGITALADLAGNYPATLFGFPLTGVTGNYITSTNPTLGINKISSELFSLSPNPTKDYININYKNDLIVSKINLYNNLGVLAKEFNISQKQFDISELSTGLYFLEINSNKGKVSYKVVKD